MKTSALPRSYALLFAIFLFAPLLIAVAADSAPPPSPITSPARALSVAPVASTNASSLATASQSSPASANTNPLYYYKFTNELGHPVSLADFRGQAVALTFFFTRCPMPEFCPRLSKNFQEASQQLRAANPPFTNWHFLSVTFDPSFDTPEILKAYGERYEYDPSHWSFLTGPSDKIGELARESGIKTNPDNGMINHNFRTLIVDPAGRLQMVFPTSGDLSAEIAAEMKKAAHMFEANPPSPAQAASIAEPAP